MDKQAEFKRTLQKIVLTLEFGVILPPTDITLLYEQNLTILGDMGDSWIPHKILTFDKVNWN